MKAGKNPRDVKLELAERIIADFHPAEAAKEAHAQWLHDVSEGQIPENLDRVQASDARVNRIWCRRN